MDTRHDAPAKQPPAGGPLAGQVAVITGAGRGIGRAIAEAYAAAGAAVVLGARRTEELEVTARSITAAGGQVAWLACDVGRDGDVSALVDLAVDRFGHLDIAVANAGTLDTFATVADSDPTDWARVIDVNLLGVARLARSAIPHLRARGGGKIVVVGSGAGRQPMPRASAYSASKAGASMLVRSLAAELRADHIAVDELIPGPVMTELASFIPRDPVQRAGGAFAGEWVKEPADVAPMALFLATLPNHGPTGQTFSLMGRVS